MSYDDDGLTSTSREMAGVNKMAARPAMQRSPISSEMQYLDEMITNVQDEISVLTDKIRAVMASDFSDTDEGVGEKEDRSMHSDLTNEIHRQATRLDHLRLQVRDTHNRIQL